MTYEEATIAYKRKDPVYLLGVLYRRIIEIKVIEHQDESGNVYKGILLGLEDYKNPNGRVYIDPEYVENMVVGKEGAEDEMQRVFL